MDGAPPLADLFLSSLAHLLKDFCLKIGSTVRRSCDTLPLHVSPKDLKGATMPPPGRTKKSNSPAFLGLRGGCKRGFINFCYRPHTHTPRTHTYTFTSFPFSSFHSIPFSTGGGGGNVDVPVPLNCVKCCHYSQSLKVSIFSGFYSNLNHDLYLHC